MSTKSVKGKVASANLAYPRVMDGSKEEYLPTVPAPLPRDGSDDIILPKWIYIQDNEGRYLAVRSEPKMATLTFRTGTPDLQCAFQTEGLGSSHYKLIAWSGNHLMAYAGLPDRKWYSADPYGPDSIPTLTFTLAKENIVYIRDNVTAGFMSNQLNPGPLGEDAPLSRNFINQDSEMAISIAAVKKDILDVNYDIPQAEVRAAPPLIALSTSVRNDSDSTETTQTLNYSYEKWSVGTWNNAAGIEIGATASFSAGVPIIASADFEISITTSYSHEWGGEEGKREVVTSSTSVVVPPKKKAQATIIIRNAQLDVGFTYTEKIFWSDGKTENTTKTGIYRNVDSWHVDVEVGDWEDIEW